MVFLPCAKKEDETGAAKILITANSNQAVDNVVKALEKFVPYGNGGRIFVELARIARKKSDLKELKKHSMDQKCLIFDEEYFDCSKQSTEKKRVWPSLAGHSADANESIVLLATNNQVCGKQFTGLRQKIDVISNDEV